MAETTAEAPRAATTTASQGFWYNFFKKTLPAEQQALIGMLMFFAIIVITGWVAVNEQSRMATFDEQYNARSVQRGAGLFATNCAPCHGANGQGTVGIAPGINNPDLFDGKRLKELGFSGTLRDYLTLTISGGRPARTGPYPNPMPTWSQQYGGPMRQDQIRDIVNFVMNWGCIYDDKCPVDKEEKAALLAAQVTPVPAFKPNETPPPTPTPAAGSVCEGGDPTKCTPLDQLPPGDPAGGEALYNQTAMGLGNQPIVCKSCHTLDGTPLVGPSWKGINDRVPDQYGSVEEYIYHSILNPSEYVREGFTDAMPKDFGGKLDPQMLADLIAFIKQQ